MLSNVAPRGRGDLLSIEIFEVLCVLPSVFILLFFLAIKKKMFLSERFLTALAKGRDLVLKYFLYFCNGPSHTFSAHYKGSDLLVSKTLLMEELLQAC